MVDLMDLLVVSEEFQPGEVIIKEGDINRDIIVLTEGVVEIIQTGEEGDYALGEINPPDLLGEISFLDGKPRAATARAKTKVEVFVLDYEKLKGEMQEVPTFVKVLIQSTRKRVLSCDDKIKQLEDEVKHLRAELTRRG